MLLFALLMVFAYASIGAAQDASANSRIRAGSCDVYQTVVLDLDEQRYWLIQS